VIINIDRGAFQNTFGEFKDMQTGDVPATWANADLLKALTGYQPKTGFHQGVKTFVAWYRTYH